MLDEGKPGEREEAEPVIKIEDEGKYEIKGQRFTVQEILAIEKWIDEHQEDLKGQAEYQEKERLLQRLRDATGERYEVSLVGNAVEIYPVEWKYSNAESPFEAEAERFPYTIEDLKDHIRSYGNEVD